MALVVMVLALLVDVLGGWLMSALFVLVGSVCVMCDGGVVCEGDVVLGVDAAVAAACGDDDIACVLWCHNYCRQGS